jgi:hypothetical protein
MHADVASGKIAFNPARNKNKHTFNPEYKNGINRIS